jgi:hypothetical protein
MANPHPFRPPRWKHDDHRVPEVGCGKASSLWALTPTSLLGCATDRYKRQIQGPPGHWVIVLRNRGNMIEVSIADHCHTAFMGKEPVLRSGEVSQVNSRRGACPETLAAVVTAFMGCRSIPLRQGETDSVALARGE